MVRTHWWLYVVIQVKHWSDINLKLSVIFNLFKAAFCSELQFLVCVKIFNFESTKVARCLDGL